MQNKSILDAEFVKGAKKARIVAQDVLSRVRTKIGYQVKCFIGCYIYEINLFDDYLNQQLNHL